ncbi:unnamed protein product [Brachionus calyciflorus]|uniref:Nucleolar protein 58 n=1 Tax=Brachionus calyciflorus TaxID=104777 RepID=A0A813R8N4_9BILA|nr:unnamed protein product [Brachionus calyciflorus]
MLVLFETAAGYAVFKLLNEKKLQETENLYLDFQTPEKANKLLQLQHFQKFDDTTIALAAITGSIEGKIPKTLKKILKKISEDEQETLLVADAKLGSSIKEKFNINCVSNNNVQDLMRLIRGQMESLIKVPEKEIAAMRIGLAHSLSRYKLKFSPDKVDTMIVQAISLLDDLDKELNNYIMRCKEWYGWHFPELAKIIQDNIAYCKTIKKVGYKTNAATTELNDILPEDVEQKVKEAAEVSMGTEISEEDLSNITNLCDQVLEISDYRNQLYEYLKNRMMAVAPNLTALVGELVGARLIAHAGSLLNLAKHPSSTVQILGAEKALFRAMKTKHDTPKYGLIYHASLVGQSGAKYKGKVSRMLAAKAALAIRVDALGEDNNSNMGIEQRAVLEKRLQQLEQGIIKKVSGTGKQKAKFEKYSMKREAPREEASEAMEADESTIPKSSGHGKKRKFD